MIVFNVTNENTNISKLKLLGNVYFTDKQVDLLDTMLVEFARSNYERILITFKIIVNTLLITKTVIAMIFIVMKTCFFL